MKIEVLYVAECPSHAAAVELVRNILIAEGLPLDVHEVLVHDEKMAQKMRFCGSPTIRVNGQDVASDCAEAGNFGLTCRLYARSEHIGLPPAELVRRAVAEARQGIER